MPQFSAVPASTIWHFALGLDSPSNVYLAVGLLLIGMYLITKGGDLFTDCAVAIARATRIPPVIIGATIVSLATTFPEFMVSLTGALRGKPDFAVGNALGSCCCNIGLIVGSCVLVKNILAKQRGEEGGIETSRETLRGAGSFMIVAGILMWLFGVWDAGNAVLPNGAASQFGIARWQGGIFVVLLVLYLFYSLRIALRARFESEIIDDSPEDQPMGKTVFGFLFGAALVVLGSRLLVSNAESLALRMGVSELIVGLTILAIGTSLPEYTISLLAVIKGHGALGIGNIIGANMLNICWVVATCALIQPLPIRSQTIYLDAPIVLGLMLLLIGLGWRHEKLNSVAGACLLAVYLGWLVFAFGLFAGGS